MNRREWMIDASCRRMGARVWDSLDVTGQQLVCGGCPVQLACLAYGLEVSAVGVVFGGHRFPRDRPYRDNVDPAALRFQRGRVDGIDDDE